ncbi:MAG: hypothetical protein H6738_24980 [Alphaproteobacteria bacterium]|nr:hypothetical protein [Alphaproteobacteria bacterium]MCB9700066.1 hypothetical protein [Alphaproteobacteria bacterium]
MVTALLIACAPRLPEPPDGVHVEVPAADLEPELRALSGTWEGRWGGLRPSRLVVERVDEREAIVVYEIARFGNGQGMHRGAAQRETARVTHPAGLAFGSLTFRLKGDHLEGTFAPSGVPPATITMRHPSPYGAAPRVLGFYALPLAILAGLAAGLRRARPIVLGVAAWLACSLVVTPIVAVSGAGSPLAGTVALSLAAGLVEEVVRYGLVRGVAALRDPGARGPALVLGAAHGATEALVFGLGADDGLLYAGARPLLVLGHVAFAALAWRAVARRDPRWLALAIALHVGLDLLGFALPVVAPGTEAVFLLPAFALGGFALAEVRAARREA